MRLPMTGRFTLESARTTLSRVRTQPRPVRFGRLLLSPRVTVKPSGQSAGARHGSVPHAEPQAVSRCSSVDDVAESPVRDRMGIPLRTSTRFKVAVHLKSRDPARSPADECVLRQRVRPVRIGNRVNRGYRYDAVQHDLSQRHPRVLHSAKRDPRTQARLS